MTQTIGFMGLGIMGSPMAANIARSGRPLVVYNRTVEKARALSDAGAQVMESPAALAAASDIIIAMVTGPEALDELLWGPEGAARELTRDKVLINMSSVSPRFTLSLDERLADSGVTFIDAPISGSKKPAEDATLLILAGGERGAVDLHTPLLQTMGRKVIYCGPVGRGSMMKMMINLLLAIHMEGLCEVLALGKKGGLALEPMLEVIRSGPLNCGLYDMKAGMVEGRQYPTNFPLKHMAKDLKFVVDTAYELGAQTPAAHAMLQLYSMGVARGLGDDDFAAVSEVLEILNEARAADGTPRPGSSVAGLRPGPARSGGNPRGSRVADERPPGTAETERASSARPRRLPVEPAASLELTDRLLAKALELGATLAGVVELEALRSSPSHKGCRSLDWPSQARSALVLALVHDQEHTSLDWWDGRSGGTPGNRRLQRVARQLKEWLAAEYAIAIWPAPYYVEEGGVFLKDAGALAGLGTIGRNNLLVTPQFGSRVRLKALFTSASLLSTGPSTFSPCEECPMPCRDACPQQAFVQGSYSRASCMRQMNQDEARRGPSPATGPEGASGFVIKYCRICELGCPVGAV